MSHFSFFKKKPSNEDSGKSFSEKIDSFSLENTSPVFTSSDSDDGIGTQSHLDPASNFEPIFTPLYSGYTGQYERIFERSTGTQVSRRFLARVSTPGTSTAPQGSSTPVEEGAAALSVHQRGTGDTPLSTGSATQPRRVLTVASGNADEDPEETELDLASAAAGEQQKNSLVNQQTKSSVAKRVTGAISKVLKKKKKPKHIRVQQEVTYKTLRSGNRYPPIVELSRTDSRRIRLVPGDFSNLNLNSAGLGTQYLQERFTVHVDNQYEIPIGNFENNQYLEILSSENNAQEQVARILDWDFEASNRTLGLGPIVENRSNPQINSNLEPVNNSNLEQNSKILEVQEQVQNLNLEGNIVQPINNNLGQIQIPLSNQNLGVRNIEAIEVNNLVNNEDNTRATRMDPTIFNTVPFFSGDNKETVEAELQTLNICAKLAYNAFRTPDEKALFLTFLPTKLRGRASVAAADQSFQSVEEFIKFLKDRFVKRETYADLSHEIRYLSQQPQESLTSFYRRVEEHYEKCKNSCKMDNPNAWREIMEVFDEVAARAFKDGIINPNHKYMLQASKEKKFSRLREKVERLEKTDISSINPSVAFNVPVNTSNFHIHPSALHCAHSCCSSHNCNTNTITTLATPNVGSLRNNNENRRNINQISSDNRFNDRGNMSSRNNNNRQNFDNRRNNNIQCHFCGRRGHVISECRQKRNTPYCNICKAYGHLQSFCENQRNNARYNQNSNFSRNGSNNRNDYYPNRQTSSVNNQQNNFRNAQSNNYRNNSNGPPRNRQNDNIRNDRSRQVNTMHVIDAGQGNQEPECDFCGERDHTEVNCIMKKRFLEIAPQNFSANNNSEN